MGCHGLAMPTRRRWRRPSATAAWTTTGWMRSPTSCARRCGQSSGWPIPRTSDVRAEELGPKLGEGREAEIFATVDGQYAVRVMRPGFSGLSRESAAMKAVRAAGGPVPEPIELTEVDGREALVMERVPAQDLLAEVGSRPWRLPVVARQL